MYSLRARLQRRCLAQRKDGHPCNAYALWDNPEQRCMAHAGDGQRGPRLLGQAPRHYRTNSLPCRCPAYQWPHRPGGGLCEWPDPPRYHSLIPAGTHAQPRKRWKATRVPMKKKEQ